MENNNIVTIEKASVSDLRLHLLEFWLVFFDGSDPSVKNTVDQKSVNKGNGCCICSDGDPSLQSTFNVSEFSVCGPHKNAFIHVFVQLFYKYFEDSQRVKDRPPFSRRGRFNSWLEACHVFERMTLDEIVVAERLMGELFQTTVSETDAKAFRLNKYAALTFAWSFVLALSGALRYLSVGMPVKKIFFDRIQTSQQHLTEMVLTKGLLRFFEKPLIINASLWPLSISYDFDQEMLGCCLVLVQSVPAVNRRRMAFDLEGYDVFMAELSLSQKSFLESYENESIECFNQVRALKAHLTDRLKRRCLKNGQRELHLYLMNYVHALFLRVSAALDGDSHTVFEILSLLYIPYLQYAANRFSTIYESDHSFAQMVNTVVFHETYSKSDGVNAAIGGEKSVAFLLGLLRNEASADECLAAFQRRYQQREAVRDLKERALIDKTFSRMQITHAICAARAALLLRLHGNPLPTLLVLFLFRMWADYLIHVAVWFGEASRHWQSALKVVDDLVGTFDPRMAFLSEQESGVLGAGLAAEITQGLGKIAIDPEKIENVLKNLDKLAHLSVRGVTIPMVTAHRCKEIESAAFQRILKKFDLSLSVFDDYQKVNKPGVWAGIEVDDWVYFQSAGFMRMIWKDSKNALYLFVDRTADKHQVIALQTLQALFNKELCIPVPPPERHVVQLAQKTIEGEVEALGVAREYRAPTVQNHKPKASAVCL